MNHMINFSHNKNAYSMENSDSLVKRKYRTCTEVNYILRELSSVARFTYKYTKGCPVPGKRLVFLSVDRISITGPTPSNSGTGTLRFPCRNL